MKGLLIIYIENNEFKKKCTNCNKIWDFKLGQFCPLCITDKCYNCLWKIDSGKIKRITLCNDCMNINII